MGERYTSVSEVVNQCIDDESFREHFQKEIRGKRLEKTLFAIRARAGKTEAEMAGTLGWDKERVRALENAGDDRITVADLTAYVRVIQLTQ